jgi:hypothetical protein
MANNTNEIQDTSEDEGKNTELSTGDGTDTSNKNQEKTLTQTEVNAILKRAKLDAEKSAKTKFEKNLEGKTVLSDDDLKTLKSEWEKEYSVKAQIQNKRAEYKTKGLSDVQLDAISVEKPEDYDKRVSELYGALLKKDAPILTGGNSGKDTDSNDISRLNEKLRQGLTRRKI